MITQALANSYKLEVLSGIHTAADVYKIALYATAATLSKDTTVYSATNEVANSGTYVAGGQVLVGFTAALYTDTAVLDWTTNPEWSNSTITARGALIYNSTQGNKAVAVLDFGEEKISSNGAFTITLPIPGAATGLIRIA